jgi:hypothetical protein
VKIAFPFFFANAEFQLFWTTFFTLQVRPPAKGLLHHISPIRTAKYQVSYVFFIIYIAEWKTK